MEHVWVLLVFGGREERLINVIEKTAKGDTIEAILDYEGTLYCLEANGDCGEEYKGFPLVKVIVIDWSSFHGFPETVIEKLLSFLKYLHPHALLLGIGDQPETDYKNAG